MRRSIKIVIYLAIILAIIGVTGFFIAPPIVKSVLTDKLSQLLQRQVSIGEVRINPYKLTAAIRGFEIREPSGSGKFVSFEELYLKVDAASIFRRALILKEIKLNAPYIRINRNEDATYNFSDLLTKFTKEKKEPEEKPAPFHFSLNNIRIERGSVDIWDGPKRTQHKVRDLNIAIPFVANINHLIDQYTQPVISANINGNAFLIQGKTKPLHDSLESVLDVNIKGFNLPYYLPYVPADLNFRLLSGFIDTSLQVSFMQSREKVPSLSVKGDVLLSKLAVNDKKGLPLIRIPSLNVAVANIEPMTSLIHLGKVILDSPEVNVKRDKQGDINLLNLVPAGKPKEEKKSIKQPKTDKKSSSPLDIRVDEFRIDKGKIAYRDDLPADPVSFVLSSLNLKVNDFSNKKNAVCGLDLSMAFGKNGSLSVSGPVTADPLSAKLALKLNKIDIRTLQGYFTDKLKIAVTSGSITVTGNASISDFGKKGLSAAYNGKFLISDFKSIDKRNSDDFLKWKSLHFNDVRVGYNPLSVDIRQIALADFYAGVIIHEDGIMNLQSVMEENPPPEADKKTVSETTTAKVEKKTNLPPVKDARDESKEKLIKIGAVTIQGGTIDFLDRSIKPNYSANLSQIGGRISGLSSIEEKPADVELRGKYQNHMPIEILGKIHPLRKDLFVDLKASFKDIDLSSASPYSGKYMGYTIQKGKLSFDLKYLIVKRKLESENKVFIDQLTLGTQVESSQATKLPVGLAIALLKDRQGQINLDLPVAGSLDDPQFSLWRLIVQVIVNLITKAVTAPFALLGNLVGGGPELGYVEFDYGRATLTEDSLKKIQTLANALRERPALKLDIEGHIDMENDREGLKKYSIERKLKAQKLNDMIRQKLPAVSVDDVTIETQEYEKYLTQAYRAEPFPKPRTALGLVKTLPVAEMEKLMMTNAVVGDDGLRLLAARRASVVSDLFLKSGQVAADRIFVIEPKSLTPEKKEKIKDSRVDFKLK